MLCVLVVFNYVAWDPAPHWGKKEKKICVAKKKKKCGERNEPGGSLGREKSGGGSAALSSFSGFR